MQAHYLLKDRKSLYKFVIAVYTDDALKDKFIQKIKF